MQYGTRKRRDCVLACAFALGLAAASALPCGTALALTIDGNINGGAEGSIDHVDKPFGQIIRIIPGIGMSALLYLPALPIYPYDTDEETGHPALQVLYVDRAYADDPSTWERWGTFEWNEDWLEYASGTNSIRPVYDYNYQDPTILYCTVAYSSDLIDYRDFYLRATAVTMEHGVLTTTVFDPALIEYEDKWIPDPPPSPDEPGEQPPNVVNPPEVDAGSDGGNRGGVSQGESERVDPESTPENLELPTEKAEALPLPSANDTDQGAQSGSNTTEGEATAGKGSPNEAVKNSEATTSSARDADESTRNELTDTPSPSSASDEERVPGFVWAIGATAAIVAVAGGVVAALQAHSRRPH